MFKCVRCGIEKEDVDYLRISQDNYICSTCVLLMSTEYSLIKTKTDQETEIEQLKKQINHYQQKEEESKYCSYGWYDCDIVQKIPDKIRKFASFSKIRSLHCFYKTYALFDTIISLFADPYVVEILHTLLKNKSKKSWTLSEIMKENNYEYHFARYQAVLNRIWNTGLINIESKSPNEYSFNYNLLNDFVFFADRDIKRQLNHITTMRKVHATTLTI